MKEYAIDTRCGLICAACTFREKFKCGGCIATNGHPFHGDCSVAVCCQNKGFLFCGECPGFTCRLLHDYSYDPKHGDNGSRIEQCRKWAGQKT
jgi:hypothetical protein